MRHAALLSPAALAVGAAVATFSLSACNKPAPSNPAPAPADTTSTAATPDASAGAAPQGALPPVETPPPTPAAQAPAAAAVAPAPPAAVAASPAPTAQYQYVDQAASMSAAFADTPPDYTVDYQGTRPWIWRSGSGAYRIVEAIPGGERYFYFMPGSPTPFLVRDPSFTYAYDDGRLVVVYDSGGRPLAPSLAARQAAMAGRYLARARSLYVAAVRERHQAAYAADWQARRASIVGQQQQWRVQQQQNQVWRAWHDQHAAIQQAPFDRERAQRQAYAARLASSPTTLSGPALARGAPARIRENNPPTRRPAPLAERPQQTIQAQADQVEVDAARQNLARAKAQTGAPDALAKAKTMDAARARLRLALQKQAADGSHRQ